MDDGDAWFLREFLPNFLEFDLAYLTMRSPLNTLASIEQQQSATTSPITGQFTIFVLAAPAQTTIDDDDDARGNNYC